MNLLLPDLPPSEISYDLRFQELATAQEWTKTPFEFDNLPLQERILMIAYTQASGQLKAVVNNDQLEEARRPKPGAQPRRR